MHRRFSRLGLVGWLLVAAALLATGAGSYYYYLRPSSPAPKRATLVQSELRTAERAYLPVAVRD